MSAPFEQSWGAPHARVLCKERIKSRKQLYCAQHCYAENLQKFCVN